ncbi:MAG TPA: CheR family methyltransferase, partial [Pyrinomonadaceae bacterium]
MNDVETAAIFGNGKPGDGANFLVVGIGASAGGIGALREFFVNVKPDSHVAYVVILHLSPDHDSKLAEVLQGVTKIPVRQVTEKTKIEQDHVYVVPPNKSLGIEDGHISVQPIKGVEERRAPVDIFFRRLAEHLQSRAVAVVLSGTGANGSMGIKRVKEFGGAAFVQNPREAEFNEMPRSSIATELIDSILPVAEIPSRILAYRDRIGAIEIPEEPKQRKSADQQALREIFTQLRLRTGHDFTNYKRATILRRIARRIGVRNLPDIESYAAYLKEHAEEPNALLKDLLISVTNFFRDAKAWEFIEKQVFPRLLQNGLSNKAIRIWVAGCATGEEAYSIAMIAAEQIFELPEVPTVQIFATDIDEQAIAIAREGTYTLNDAADVSPERLRRFFSKDGDNYRVKRELREMVLFANHNVLKDPPFSHLDIATCRNLMIYLNHEAQERIMETLHFALNPGGYLFVGSSESIDGAGDLFAPLSKQKHVFQSRQVTTRPLPIPESVPEFRSLHIQSQKTEDTANEKSPLERITYNLLHVKLLEQYAPPSVVVNENYDIVHLSSAAGKYLRVAGGEPTNNLMRLVLPDLRLDLRTALYQAVRQRTNVEAENVKVKTREGDEKINILVRPVLDDKDTSRGFILVVFEQEGKAKVVKHESVYAQPEPLAQQLEEELIRSKSQLHSALEQAEIQSEELRASNEELQAMNEELRSSAEELETGKEELQSINEEMATVNQELKVKIEELSHTNNNFTNLLNSIDIGVIFLDRGLRINLFSPAASRIFNLIPGDIGRPLSDITSRLDYGDLPADADHVLEKLQTVEREVETAGGEVFVMRVVPYRTVDDHINGVVLTFVEITERKRAEKGLRESKARLQSLANLVPDLLWETDPDGLTTWFNQRWMEYTGQTLEEAVGWGWTNAIHPDDRKASARRYKEAVEKGEPLRQEHRILRHDAAYRWFIVNAFPLKDENGRVIKMYGSATDIHDHRVAMEAIRFSEERMRALMDSFTEIAIFTTDTEGIVTAWNPGS